MKLVVPGAVVNHSGWINATVSFIQLRMKLNCIYFIDGRLKTM